MLQLSSAVHSQWERPRLVKQKPNKYPEEKAAFIHENPQVISWTEVISSRKQPLRSSSTSASNGNCSRGKWRCFLMTIPKVADPGWREADCKINISSFYWSLSRISFPTSPPTKKPRSLPNSKGTYLQTNHSQTYNRYLATQPNPPSTCAPTT